MAISLSLGDFLATALSWPLQETASDKTRKMTPLLVLLGLVIILGGHQEWGVTIALARPTLALVKGDLNGDV